MCPSVRLLPTPSSSWKREIVNLSVGRVEIPDEGGSNPVVLVAPVKRFPLQPREQLPHGLKHICHRGHHRGDNHLGATMASQQSALWQQIPSLHLLFPGLHRLHAHLVEKTSSFAGEAERDVLKIFLNATLIRIFLLTVLVKPGRDCSGNCEEVRGTRG